MIRAEGPNAQQIQYWNEEAGVKWVELSDQINDQIEELGHVALEVARPQPGESVLEVGCGCGHTSRELANKVGESGRVLAVDISEPMLAAGRQRSGKMPQLDFLAADAQTHPFEESSFDLVFSRFGVMFFAQPLEAFGNVCRALRPGGRVAFVCWREPAMNPWMQLPARAALQHLEPSEPADPHAPGPFAFAESDRLREILEGAGFEDVQHSSHEAPLTLGRGLAPEAAIEFILQMGPAGRAMRAAEKSVREAIRQSVTESVAPYHGDDGVVMDSAVWIVTAKREPAPVG